MFSMLIRTWMNMQEVLKFLHLQVTLIIFCLKKKEVLLSASGSRHWRGCLCIETEVGGHCHSHNAVRWVNKWCLRCLSQLTEKILPSSLLLKFIQQPKSCKPVKPVLSKKCEAVESWSCDSSHLWGFVSYWWMKPHNNRHIRTINPKQWVSKHSLHSKISLSLWGPRDIKHHPAPAPTLTLTQF